MPRLLSSPAALVIILCLTALWQPASAASSKRQIIPLDGPWSIQKGGPDQPFTAAEGQVPVPSLTDMAVHANGSGDYWWYQRTFQLDSLPTAVALLKINKAMFGTQVFLNGHKVDEYFSSFSPSYHDVLPWLHFNGDNLLVIRVGERSTLPASVLNMNDFEKTTYTPGIYDSVSLILDDNPHIETIQTNPRPDGTLEIKAVIQNESGEPYEGPVHFAVSRNDNQAAAGDVSVSVSIPARGEATVSATVLVQDCQFWSPEQPFLYDLTTETAGDQRTDRIGMRTFDFNPATKMPELNGKPCALLGTNVCIYRFFEDAHRSDLPWNRKWVRALLKKFKTMHWNCLRLSLGPPPDFWYDLCDEEGILIQDENPIWYSRDYTAYPQDKVPAAVTVDDIVAEVTPCLYDRANHPCIFLWDLANETMSEKVKQAIPKLRPIDLQGRRWEDGTRDFTTPVDSHDPAELHLYPFFQPHTLEVFNQPAPPEKGTNPLIVNEYGWLWLARDGSPTRLTARLFGLLVGGGIDSHDYGTEADRRYTAATYLAANTEFLRCSRQYQGIEQFCGLDYSRPNANPAISGQTSDNFLEPLSSLTFDPYFENYLRDAFAPVGLCVGRYDAAYPAGSDQAFPVSIYNDSPQPWQGDVRLMVVAGGPAITKKDSAAIVPAVSQSFVVGPGEKVTQPITLQIPTVIGDYTLVAEYGDGADRVQSVRDFVVGKQPRWVMNGGIHPPAPAAK